MLQRESNGHSPTEDDIAAARALKPSPSPAEVKAALPAIGLALQSPDAPARTFTLSLLVSLETPCQSTRLRRPAPPTRRIRRNSPPSKPP